MRATTFFTRIALPLLLAVMALFAVSPAFAQIKNQQQAQGYLNTAGQAGFGNTTTATPGSLVGSIISGVLGFVGTIAFVMFMYGGFLWLTARGNSEQVAEAKKYIFNATLGAVVIIMAYSATYYITTILYNAASTAH